MRIKFTNLLLFTFITPFCLLGQTVTITGTVKDAETREPLRFATVQLLPEKTGTTTNEQGNFSLNISSEKLKGSFLIISFIGYKTDSLVLSGKQLKYNILLTPDLSALKEVIVTSGTMKEVTKMNSPIPVEIYSPALFMKNPTPSIFESLSMVNGVQPQLNCNVCNTGDIHINGMEGPYTMVLIDGMPIVSSLATVYGLAGIPNSMVKRIEVVKGPASTLYGSEAVGGLINIITKDPVSSPFLHVDVSATSLQEYNGDISTKWKVKNTQALLGLNYFNFRNKIDINDDNFTDVTQQNRFSVFNKWQFERRNQKQATLALRYVYEDRWGGELQWNKQYRGSDEIYGESIYTNRFETIGNYQLPGKENITLDGSYNYHLQDSYYGAIKYFAEQHVLFTQLRWDKKIGNHDLLIGLPFRYMYYDDNTVGTLSDDTANPSNQPMETFLPGLFVQNEYSVSKKMTLLTGIRYDHHNRHGNILSPRVSAKYSPNSNNTFRLSTGNGFRVVNLFTEDHAALTGARKVFIKNELKPEQSWNVNLNYATNIPHASGYVNLDASVFYTYFTNKIIGDFITAPDSIIYDNIAGHAISKGITLNTDIAFTNSLKIMAGVTVMDVYQKENDETGHMVKKPQMFAPVVSGTYAISYALDKYGISFDLTGRLNGPMHLPVVPNDFRPEKSPWFTTMNFQITKTFTNGLEIYTGAKNILNFIPKHPLLRPFDPFDKNVTINNPEGYTFDTSYNYAPVQGIKGFAGLRYTIQ
ncbi:TonB-dependent receptor [Chryseosolibacter indicus]|uniref:TonB-dependent receptor n=1 Tax=Chryseosolibacter indicus TaxID=2782351 RepID=A0ABS5VVE1_9BACT|nr:TonB-dependent receptor [Chryseosolibacter indicus]MBT1705402.1 TonB-dependent receptor [Chryseosolibacter indicus]